MARDSASGMNRPLWRHATVFALVVLLVTGQPAAQGLSRAAPESVGMSSDRLARFDTLAVDAIRQEQVAGLVTLVVRSGKVVHHGAYGALDLATRAPMPRDAIFRIASMTKPVISVAAMMLIEEGKLLLSDPVARYLPGFKQTTVALQGGGGGGSLQVVPARRVITVRDLLTHTAGIPNPRNLDGTLLARYRDASLGAPLLNALDEPIGSLMERLPGLPFVAQPGERFVYGFSTDVLGAVIERSSGLALDEFLRRRIFAPLGMHDTHFFLPLEKTARLAATHNPKDGGGLVRGRDDDMEWTGQGAFVHGPRRAFSGGGGLLSTANDYARFLQMLLNGGELDGARILSPASVRLMTTNHVGDLYAKAENLPGMGFGFGFEVKLEPGVPGFDIPAFASPGAFAWGGAAFTTFWVDPEQQLVAVFLAQLRPYAHLDLSKKFGNIVYHAILDRAR
jgi:CubicO group peptidase (beta-lactamase class C family)